MAAEFEELLLKVRADVNGAIADLKRFDRAVDETNTNVKKSTEKTSASIDDTAKSTKKLADESEKTEKKVKSDFEKMTGASKTAADAYERNFAKSHTAGQAFDRTIRELNVQVKTLGTLYSKTGDDKFLKRMQQADADAKKLAKTATGLGAALGKDVTKGAESASGALGDMGPVLAGVAAMYAPLIGGALSGAILGGVGLGGLAAGVAGQLNSPLVKTAEDQFVSRMQDRFTDSTSAFAPELRDTLGSLDANLGPFWDSLKKGFTGLAPYLKVFSDGFARFLNESGPGIEAAFEGAEPVLTAIAIELPELGKAVTRFFQQLQAGGTGAAESIGVLFVAIEEALVITGYALRGLSDSVDWVVNGLIRVFDFLGKLPSKLGGGKFKGMADDLRNFQTQVSTSTVALGGLQGGFRLTNDAMQEQHAKLLQLNTDWTNATDAAMTYDNAQLRSVEAGQALSKSIKENGRDWDMAHEKGQANWHALLNDIQAKKDLYDADVKVHGITKDNTTAYQGAIDKLLAQAKAAGLSKAQIDLLRQQYENLGATLDKLNGRKVTFTIQGNVTGAIPGARAAIASVLGNSGVHHFDNSGVAGGIPHFDMTGTYAGRPGGIYRFAESSTGEEALIARNGDSGRAMSTLRQAASWQGATVVSNNLSSTYSHAMPATSGGGGGGDTMLYATIVMDSKPIARAIVPAVQRANSRSAVSTLG